MPARKVSDMPYEGDRALSLELMAVGVAAAAFLRRPTAFAILAALGLMLSNPGSMAKAAGEWRGDEGEAVLDKLSGDMDAMRTRIHDEGKWEGEAYEAFSASVDDFKAQILRAKEHRHGAADTLDQTAALYHAVLQFIEAVVGTLTFLATLLFTSQLYPPVMVAAMAAVDGVLVKLDAVVKAVVSKKLMFVGGVLTILWMVNSLQQSQERLFYGMQAMPAQDADFTQVGLEYDKSGGLVKKPDTSALSVPDMKGKSFMPGIPGL